ncbi:MAG: cytochrome ubiquinol oxidase subunit I [Acidobacteria bacterium]|nr:cytochrome ubiquinol oxidase subunit I [Acidobacteriota bacterium]
MDNALTIHRVHFAFTVMFHYIFPQLTMGLAPLIVVLKTIAMRNQDERYDTAARFWGRVLGLNFVLGVVTGIPLEFQFGTNWSEFSRLTGGVLGQPLVMEGVFSFFLESAFLGLLLFGEERLGRRGHWATAFAVFLGSWLSGFFIVAANAWMQHPVAYARLPNGSFQAASFWSVLLNHWALLEYLHTMSGAMITGAFVMAALGAFYWLNGQHREQARIYIHIGVVAGLMASAFQIFPSGDLHGRYLAHNQPITTAAMEGLFNTQRGAPMVVIGQPNPQSETIDNPLLVNRALSFLIYGTFTAEVQGLNAFPREDWPGDIALLFFAYHIMAGLGTVFLAVMLVCAFLLWRGTFFDTRWALWLLLLCVPLPYIANTAGWVSAEVGRQPWLVYGLLRTNAGYSHMVSIGNAWFTLLGFMGLYTLLSIFFLFLIQHTIAEGPRVLPQRPVSLPRPHGTQEV